MTLNSASCCKLGEAWKNHGKNHGKNHETKPTAATRRGASWGTSAWLRWPKPRLGAHLGHWGHWGRHGGHRHQASHGDSDGPTLETSPAVKKVWKNLLQSCKMLCWHNTAHLGSKCIITSNDTNYTHRITAMQRSFLNGLASNFSPRKKCPSICLSLPQQTRRPRRQSTLEVREPN